MKNLFIGIAGIMGAGKTTLATMLANHLGLPILYEPVTQNEYLADFYRDMHRYAFTMQIYLLNERFRQHQCVIWSGRGGVQDRTIYEDTVFARMLWRNGYMDQRDYDTYTSLFDNMANFMRKPNMIVYLDVSPQVALERIKERDRGCETNLELTYLEELYAEYATFIQDIGGNIPVIRINWDKYLCVEKVAERIAKEYTGFSFLQQRIK